VLLEDRPNKDKDKDKGGQEVAAKVDEAALAAA